MVAPGRGIGKLGVWSERKSYFLPYTIFNKLKKNCAHLLPHYFANEKQLKKTSDILEGQRRTW